MSRFEIKTNNKDIFYESIEIEDCYFTFYPIEDLDGNESYFLHTGYDHETFIVPDSLYSLLRPNVQKRLDIFMEEMALKYA